MKKTILIALMAIVTLRVSAQEVPQFMGIPIDGSPKSFGQKLENKGFKDLEYDNGFVYSGEFAGRDCHIMLGQSSNLLYQVFVILGEETSWTSYKSELSELKEMYDSKYGEGHVIESYEYPYEKGDGHELTALRLGRLNYGIQYKEHNIMILISSGTGIVISYENPRNKAFKEASNMNDI